MKSNLKKIVHVMLIVMLSVSLVPAGSIAGDTGTVQALAKSDQSQQTQAGSQTADDQSQSDQTESGQDGNAAKSEKTKKVLPKTAKTVKQDGFKLKFKQKVLIEKPLNANSEPLNMNVRVRTNSRKITWDAARKPDRVDGYIILRRSGGKSVYKQIAMLKASRRSYKDKISSSKNADYTIVGYRKTDYGIRISPCSGYGRAPGRKYQNPSRYVQISNKISHHGLSYYSSPVLVNKKSTKKDHIEAMIKTAYKYKGDRFVVCRSGRPGEGLDCSGLVMQACYGAGVDLWPVNPWRHRFRKYEYESRNIAALDNLETVSYWEKKRGDLIFFCNSRGTIIHVAIYLGNNTIIHSTSVGNRVVVTGMGGGTYGRPCLVKRVFN